MRNDHFTLGLARYLDKMEDRLNQGDNVKSICMHTCNYVCRYVGVIGE